MGSESSGFAQSQSSQAGQSGASFLPWQEAAAQKIIATYLANMEMLSAELAQQGGPTAGQGEDFAGYMTNVGGTPPTFSDVTASPIWSDRLLREAVNDIWATQEARAAQAPAMRPGFGSNSPLLAELMAANRARASVVGGQQENQLRQRAAIENAQHMLNAQMAQTNVENLRSADERQRRQLALGVRGQDLGFAGQKLSSLLGALSSGGSFGFLQPLPWSWNRGSSSSYSQQKSRQGAGVGDMFGFGTTDGTGAWA